MVKMYFLTHSILLVFVFVSGCICKDVFRFASHYESHMVLQRAPHRAVLWGYGSEKDQKVDVELIGFKTYTTKTFETLDGFVWKVVFDPISAGGPFKITASTTSQEEAFEVTISDVLFGDVWFCGGQSNMEFTVSMSFNAAKEIANAENYPNIRLFTVNRYLSSTPVSELKDENILQHWNISSKDTVGGKAWQYFSAVCWIYGRKLYDLYKIPIGLISSNYGGTCAEAWSSPDVINVCDLEKSQERRTTEWLDDRNNYTVLWNAMIHPFINTTIKGAIWYQGERNALINPMRYNCTFPAMIADWRSKWHEGTYGNTKPVFPFGFVQLAPLGKDGKREYYAFVRWQQTAGYGYVPNPSQPNVFMAVAMDLPDDKSPYGTIHPRDKTTVSDRLILGARTLAYGESLNFQGPIIDSCKIVEVNGEETLEVAYRNIGIEGIVIKTQAGFEVLTKDQPNEWIPVEIQDISPNHDRVYIKPPVDEVVALRYAWAQEPCEYKNCAIYSATDELPAPPFFCEVTHAQPSNVVPLK